MNKELFGVFGGPDDFERFVDPDDYDVVVGSSAITVGLRTPDLGIHGRSASYRCDRGRCLLFGEVIPPGGVENAAKWLFERYESEGPEVLSRLNGSYLCAIATDDHALVITDPLRTWECYYTDVAGRRAFGTDISRLASLYSDPPVNRSAVLELLHLGTVLGDRTLFDPIRRAPPDGYLAADRTGSLERFLYNPSSFDYAGTLANRLERAIERRSHYPGRSGVLLSAGMDSRVFLSQIPDIGTSFTVSDANSREARVARRVAEQYATDHRALEPDAQYLCPSGRKLVYSQSIKEALHIHHAGYADAIDTDVVYHGLMFDTLFKGYFLERDGISVFGSKLPSRSLVSDPDIIDSLLDTLGFFPERSADIPAAVESLVDDLGLDVDLRVDSARAFLRDRMEAELEACWRKAGSAQNAMDLLIIRNQPVLPFRTHLADNFCESFVSMDAELLDWHLRTPPQYRNAHTFERAITKIDSEILNHRPPSEPHGSSYLNQAERFLRRKLPVIEQFEPAWPDRREIYESYDLAAVLFPDHPGVQDLRPRQQLRVNDLRWWVTAVRDADVPVTRDPCR